MNEEQKVKLRMLHSMHHDLIERVAHCQRNADTYTRMANDELADAAKLSAMRDFISDEIDAVQSGADTSKHVTDEIERLQEIIK